MGKRYGRLAAGSLGLANNPTRTAGSMALSGGDVPTPPVNITPPSIAGTPVVGETLTATPGTYSGTEPITVTGKWQRNGVDIPLATNLTYVPVQADAGNTANIKYVENASNEAGEIDTDSNTIAQILDALANSVLNRIVAVGGTTGSTVINATNTHYIAIRAAGILAKLNMLRLNRGGTQSSIGVDGLVPANAVDTYVGGNTFNSNGLTTNGTNSSRRTVYNVSTQPTNNQSFGWYISADCTGYIGGAGINSDGSTIGRTGGSNFYGVFDLLARTFTGNRRFNLAANRVSGNISFIRDGVVVSTLAQAFVAKRSSLWITGALNIGTAPTITPAVFNANLYKYEWIGDSLSDAEVITYQGLINQYMTDLGINNY